MTDASSLQARNGWVWTVRWWDLPHEDGRYWRIEARRGGESVGTTAQPAMASVEGAVRSIRTTMKRKFSVR